MKTVGIIILGLAALGLVIGIVGELVDACRDRKRERARRRR